MLSSSPSLPGGRRGGVCAGVVILKPAKASNETLSLDASHRGSCCHPAILMAGLAMALAAMAAAPVRLLSSVSWVIPGAAAAWNQKCE